MSTPIGPPEEEKKYYGVFNEKGDPRGFYISDIYTPEKDGSRNAKIPKEAIEITRQVWWDLLEGQPLAQYHDGKVTMTGDPPIERPPEDLFGDVKSKISELMVAMAELKEEIKQLKEKK